jgi:hypothetical protein
VVENGIFTESDPAIGSTLQISFSDMGDGGPEGLFASTPAAGEICARAKEPRTAIIARVPQMLFQPVIMYLLASYR